MTEVMERSAFTKFSTQLEDRLVLRGLGFVRVDGLTPTSGADPQPKMIAASSQDLCRHGTDNGVSAIVTRGGEIWIARHTDEFVRANRRDLIPLLARLCSQGPGAYVPCSNGEEIHLYHLLARNSDPDYVPR